MTGTTGTPAGAFNFVFIPSDADYAKAGTIEATQNNTGSGSGSVSLQLASGATSNFSIDTFSSNRGDYHVQLYTSSAHDVEEGVLIAAIANNGVNHGQGQGVQYGTAGIDSTSGYGQYFISLSEAGSGNEYNANVSAGYFDYNHYLAGWADTGANGGELSILELESGIGYDLARRVPVSAFEKIENGVFKLTVRGLTEDANENTLTDGILLAVSGKNEDNFALSRPTDDGTGFLIGVRDNGIGKQVYEQDPVSFVYLEVSNPDQDDLTFGRVLGDGSSAVQNGNYSIVKTGTGTYFLQVLDQNGAVVDPSGGTLVVTAEGFDMFNQDNIVSFEQSGNGWIIQTRDSSLPGGSSLNLQDAGISMYGAGLPENTFAPIDTSVVAQLAAGNQVEDYINIWQNADIDYAFITGHRGGNYEYGRAVTAENSIQIIQEAAVTGTNMVEIDIRKTSDGEFILMHDSAVNRTTNGTGGVSAMTLAQIKALDLLDPATGAATNLEVPTLREALLTAKDTVMINLDMRVSQSDFDDVLQIAHDEGVLDQVVIKDNVTVAGISNVSTDISNYATSLGVDRSDINFMPIIDDGEFDTLAKVEQLFQNLMPDAVEIVINPTENDLVEDGGFLFSSAVQALAEQYDVRLWANSLFGGYSHGGQFSGERDDFLGIYDQDAVYGFWRDQGASAIQTDETRIAIDYFEANGGRPALDTHNNLYLTHGDDDVDGTSAADQIFGLQGNDNIWAHEGDDIVWGGSGNDTLVGNNGDDRIIGGDGDDWLSGNYGADTLIGDTGNDTLRGGYGDDLLTGGAGADVFLFRAVNATAHDTITDFDAGAGTGDVIKFEGGSLTSYLDVMAVAVETGSDTVITIDANRSITLQGVGTSSLHQDDFVFA